MQSIVLSAPLAEGLCRYLLATELVGVGEMEKRMAHCCSFPLVSLSVVPTKGQK